MLGTFTVWAENPVRSPLLRVYYLLLRVLRWFSSPGSLYLEDSLHLAMEGLPHSEIVGSRSTSDSPTRIAAASRPSSARRAEASTVCSLCLPDPPSGARLGTPGEDWSEDGW